MKIYGVYRSRATRNYWLAGELDLEVEAIPVLQANKLADPLADDAPLNTASPAYLALTPTAAIPCLDDEGFVLTESLAINLYLAKKHGGPIAPSNLQEEALVLQWSLYGATSIEPHALNMMYLFAASKQDSPEGKADIEDLRGKLRRPLAVLQAHFSQSEYLVAGRFTVADINLAEIIRYAQPDASFLAEFPALLGWLTRCQARPAFQAMWTIRNAEPL